MIETRTYPAMSAFPAVGPLTGPARMVVEGRVTRVLLVGTFVARVQISNAQATSGTDAGFTPPDGSFTTYRTLNAALGDTVADIPNPVRWVRVVLDSGSITSGSIVEDTRAAPRVAAGDLLPLVIDRVDAITPGVIAPIVTAEVTTQVGTQINPVRIVAEAALAAQANTLLTQLNSKPQSAGPQFVDGSRWLSQITGTATINGGTVVAGSGHIWVREREPGLWRADWWTGYNADWGVTLTHIVSLMASGDTLSGQPITYNCNTTFSINKPINFEFKGARILANHDTIALDMYPSEALLFVGDKYGNAATYTGYLPDVERMDGRGIVESASIGVRINNAYFPNLIFGAIKRFATGFLLTANRAATAGRDLGVSYGNFYLGRLENRVNISTFIGANPGVGLGPNNYITENNFHGGSFSSGSYEGVISAEHKHILIVGATKDGMCNNLRFLNVSLEGWATIAVQVFGYAEGIIVTGRAEMPYATLYTALGADSRNCKVELTNWAYSRAQLDKTSDTGRWNRIIANEFPYGYIEYMSGIWTIQGKNLGVEAPFNWRPRVLEDEPIQEIVYTNQALPIQLDLTKYRRFRVTNTAGAMPVPLVTLIYEPAIPYEVEIELVQSAAPGATLSDYWIAQEVKWGSPAPNGTPRANGKDIFRIYVEGGIRTPTRKIIKQ